MPFRRLVACGIRVSHEAGPSRGYVSDGKIGSSDRRQSKWLDF